jgi:hypothetical protein
MTSNGSDTWPMNVLHLTTGRQERQSATSTAQEDHAVARLEPQDRGP